MHKSYINIKNGLLFPFQFQILGYVFLFAGIALTVINIWASIIFILLGGFIVTAIAGVEFKNQSIREYNSFFFIRFGKWEKLGEVEKIFIKKIKRSQKFYGRANQSSTIRNVIYKAFLKFENGNTVLLSENKDKINLEEKVQKLNQYFNTEIVDYTS
ncbi:hypothetical protein [Marivirga sp.]|uniref:hypothetical protein n=1 Tax=Marivirga sp. TaxID=2018662 RepID=UPI003DA75E2A